MTISSFLRSFDQYPINFLKGKFFKALPGAIFSLIMTIISIGLLIACLLYYFLQRNQISLTYETASSFQPEPKFPNNDINISIGVYNSSFAKENLQKVYSYYRLSTISLVGNKLKLKIIPVNINEKTLNFTLTSNYIDLTEQQVNFPRAMLQSCKVLFLLKNMTDFVIYDKEDDKYLEGCSIDIENFYIDPKIDGIIFFYYFSTYESYLATDAIINTEKREIRKPFLFKKNTHNFFVSSQKKMAVLYDNKLFKNNNQYQFYTSWTKTTKIQLKSFTEDFDVQQIFSLKYDNEIMTYKIIITPFFTILPWLGSMNMFMTCLTVIPGIWHSYYLSIFIFKYYKKKYPNDKSIENQLGFNIDKINYCKWLWIKFGCCFKAHRINYEMVRMRKELSRHFETLYRRNTVTKKEDKIVFDFIHGVEINSELQKDTTENNTENINT